MAGKLEGSAIVSGSITSTQLDYSLNTTITDGSGPKITQIQVTDSSYNVINDTAVSTSGGYIKITGTGFAAGAIVVIGNTNATSTGFVSSTTLNVQVPALSANTYVVYVVNSDGGTAIGVPGVTYSAEPVWVTGSTLPNAGTGQAFSIQLNANNAVSYSLQAGSSLPPNTTLTSGGLLSGNVTVQSDTTYNFTIVATDAEAQDSPRAFSLQVLATLAAFTISPAVSGKSTWDLAIDGPLSLTTAGTWTIGPLSSWTANAKIWGSGGGGGNGGGGGAATAQILFEQTKTYTLIVGAVGTAGSGSAGSGGSGGTGINNGVTHVLIAAGGGGGLGGAGGGGGGTAGEAGGRDFNDGFGGGGGTQSSAGGGGAGRSGYNGGSGTGPGSLTGGNGGDGGQRDGYVSGGTGYGNGGRGGIRSGDSGGGGGGGGYYGGGGGGVGGSGGGGGGGGSGYVNTSLTTNGTIYSAVGTTPGNSADSNRGTAGNANTAGKIYLYV